jgi:hypothetical protein
MGKEKAKAFSRRLLFFFLGCIAGLFGITDPVMVSGRFVGVVVPPRRPALIESRENGLSALYLYHLLLYFREHCLKACSHLELSTTMSSFKTIPYSPLIVSFSYCKRTSRSRPREALDKGGPVPTSLGFPLGCGRHVLPQSRACDKRQPGFDLYVNL